MSNRFAPFVVALEEHYWDLDLVAYFPGREGKRLSQVEERLQDITNLRLKEMDEAGIDVQVLSHGAPAMQRMEADAAVQIARSANDRLPRSCRPTRTASPPSPSCRRRPEGRRRRARARRHQARLQGRDDPRPDQRPVHRRQALLADLRARRRRSTCRSTCTRRCPHPAVVEAYYKDYRRRTIPSCSVRAWGYTVETATQGIRLVLSAACSMPIPGSRSSSATRRRAFRSCSGRIDETLSRRQSPPVSFRDTFCEHF